MLLLCWMQMLTSNRFPKMSAITFKKFIPGIAWFFLVAVLVFLPGSDLPKIEWLGIPHFDKLVHAGLFGGIVFLFCMPFFRGYSYKAKCVLIFLLISLLTILWGLAVEFIQKYFVYGRSFDWYDWLADSVGVVCALILSLFILYRNK